MERIIRPSKAEIEARILEIESLDLTFVEIEEIKNLLTLLFTGYAVTTPLFDSGLTLYRGIPYDKKPETISYLSYPPKEIAKINRASREKQPIFYCATSRQVPFFELGAKPNDKLVISKWKTTRKLLVNNIGYTDSNFAALNSNRNNQKWNNEKEHPETLKEENVIIQNFLAKTFSQVIPKNETKIYKLTIAIAEKLYFGEMFEGLLYPTIPMKANADNFAIKPAFIDSGGLVFEEVEFIEVTKMDDFKYEIKVLDWANSISDTGVIEWKGRLPQWTIKSGGQLTFTPNEENKWIVKDESGNIVEPE